MDRGTITANKPHLKIMGIIFNIYLHKYLKMKLYKMCLTTKRKSIEKNTQLSYAQILSTYRWQHLRYLPIGSAIDGYHGKYILLDSQAFSHLGKCQEIGKIQFFLYIDMYVTVNQ
jgi:hypothetical protein